MSVNLATSIDSCRIRLPLKKVEIVGAELLDSHQGNIILVNKETGEELGTSQSSTYHHKQGDVLSTKYSISKGFGKNRAIEEFLDVGISSKLLESDYLSGITRNNVQLLHDNLLQQDVVKVELDTLLDSQCYDIDLKYDFINEAGKRYWNTLTEFSKSSNKQDSGYRRFPESNRSKITGLQWSDRRTRSPIGLPFVKTYNKDLQMKLMKSQGGMIEYKQAYGISVPKELTRIEATIKNTAHCKSLGITSNKLKDLVMISSERMESMIGEMLGKHMEGGIKLKRPIVDVSNKDAGWLNLVQVLMDQYNWTWYQVKQYYLKPYESAGRLKYSRQRRKLEKFYEDYIEGSKSAEESEFVESLFGRLGVFK